MSLASLLLHNRNQRQTLFKNSFWLGIADALSRITKLVLTLYVVRVLGTIAYGKFTFAFAFVSLFSTLFDFGLTPVVTREFAKNPREEWHFPALLALKLGLGCFLLSTGAVVAYFITPDPIVRRLVIVLAAAIWISEGSATYYAFFRSRQRMEYESWLSVLGSVSLGLGGFILLTALPSIEVLAYSYLLASAAVALATSVLAMKKQYPVELRIDRVVWRRYLALATPLALFALVTSIYMFSDSVILGSLGQIEETGFYNAALRIAGLAIIPMNLVLPAFFPVLSSALQADRSELQTLFDRELEVLIFTGFLITFLTLPLARTIIGVVFTDSFAPAAGALQIVVFVPLLQYLWAPYNQMLIVSNEQTSVFIIHLGAAVLNIGLNVLLIPGLSLYGAAMASVLTHLTVLCVLVLAVARRTSVDVSSRGPWSALLAATAAGLGVWGVLLLPAPSGPLFLLFRAGGGTIGYWLGFFAMRKVLVRVQDLPDLLRSRRTDGWRRLMDLITR